MKNSILCLLLSLIIFLISGHKAKGTDKLTQQISKEIISGLLDENGHHLFKNKINNSDTLPSDAISERYLTGLGTGDQMGYSVAGAGDMNGDGFDDIIAGAPYNDAGGTDAGRVYVYLGGNIFNTVPDLLISGSANYLFGSAIAGAGDVNSDGYADIIIGAPGYNSNSGRAYIYFGGSTLNNVVDVTITGSGTGLRFAASLSTAGDINGDGFSDVMIGVSGFNSNTGRVNIYYGGSPMNSTVDRTITGFAVSNFFGYSLSNAGDFNGDGFSDIIIGSYGYNSNEGRIYLYLGGSMVDTLSDVTVAGSAGSMLGYNISEAGDFNGDGYGDFIGGAPGFSSGFGRAYVYLGNPALTPVSVLIISGENSLDSFGTVVSKAGDYNCDGYDDVIVTSTANNSGTGKAYLYKGGENSDTRPDKYFYGGAAGDNFGYSASECGDINNDGISDFVIGEINSDQNGTNSGRAYVFINSLTGTDLEDLVITGGGTGDELGNNVSDAGDVNGDGFDDVIVGVQNYNGAAGRAYIYFGGGTMDNVPDVTLNGVTAGDRFGTTSGAGDVNGDGFDDVIVGAHGYSGGSYHGRAYIFYGGSSMNSTVDVLLPGASANDRFGFSVSKAGDVNSDGFADVIVGAYGYSGGSNTGRASIFYGGNPMNSSADVTITGPSSGEEFGYSVSGGGDFNGDGYSDVIVGSPNFGGDHTGKATIFFGGNPMNSGSDGILTGASGGDYFGYSVSDAGDVNGDGFSDVISGAFGYNSGIGRAYIYYGGISMNTTSDVSLTGITENDYLGYAVSSAGDVNADGYSDVIAGTIGYNGLEYKGRTYVYFGGISMNNVSDVFMTGEGNDNLFGNNVSGAGDLNADGYSDLIVGAPSYNVHTGRAYIYFSSSTPVIPRISSVKDIPFDQGGFVNLTWQRSGYDADNQNIITGYLIERSPPPGIHGFVWNAVTTVPATYNAQYFYAAPTLSDSLTNNNGVMYFRITAQTSQPAQYWRSNILSGYSVDNLAPFAPSALTANSMVSYVALNWDQNLEADIHHYIIYRNGVEIATSVNSNFDDQYVSEDSTYDYQVAAVDIHGNKSSLSDTATITINQFGSINLSVIMEGFYNSSSNEMSISDTINLYLRNSSSPYALADSSKGVIDKITFTGSFNITNAITGNYYIVIRHRNTIETWSALPVSYTSGSVVNYSFTTSAALAYGNNQKNVDASPVSYGIYSGDVNQDGSVDLTDIVMVYNNAGIFLSGYYVTDLNGDYVTDLTDIIIVYNNSSAFVTKEIP